MCTLFCEPLMADFSVSGSPDTLSWWVGRQKDVWAQRQYKNVVLKWERKSATLQIIWQTDTVQYQW